LVELLKRRQDLEVAGESSGLDLDAFPASLDVAVLECVAEAGLEVCQTLHHALPSLPLVLLGASRDLAYIMGAFRAGGTVYVPPDVGLEGLLAAIDDARREGRAAGPYLARPSPGEPRETPVSRREREVLALVAQGKANKEIGRALSISENTVRNHIANIFGKLGVRDRTEAAVHALKRGLL
jgi:DNA-binding NarL/FixJ family response regulator